MQESRIMPIATEWYKPRTEDRSFATNLQLGRVLTEFYGKGAIGLCRNLVAGMAFPTEVAEKILERCNEAR